MNDKNRERNCYGFPIYSEQEKCEMANVEEKINHNKKYSLFMLSYLMDDDYDNDEGVMTDLIYSQINSNSLKYLKTFFIKNKLGKNYATSGWHFIYDNELKKVIEVLSCSI